MKLIPCKKNKCILLPVCKTKLHLTCKDLYNYHSLYYCVPGSDAEKQIDECFPIAVAVFDEEQKIGRTL
jgi:hypothetical protein